MKSIIVVWFLAAIGWILNICQVVQGSNVAVGDMSVYLVVKIIAIFVAPVGSLLGWVDLIRYFV